MSTPINLFLVLIFLLLPDVLFSSTTNSNVTATSSMSIHTSSLFLNLGFLPCSHRVPFFPLLTYFFKVMLFIFSLFCIYFSCCRALFLCLLHFLSLLFFSRRETGDNFTSLYSSNINIEHSLVVSSLGSLTSYVFFTHFHPSRNTCSNEET